MSLTKQEQAIKNVLRRYQMMTLDWEVGHRLLSELLAAIRENYGEPDQSMLTRHADIEMKP